jgi:hypothetical protein
MEKENIFKRLVNNLNSNPLKWIAFVMTIICFVFILIACWIRQDDANQYYIHYGRGMIFITSLWYFLISVFITYVGISFIIFTTNNFNIYVLLAIMLFLGINVIFNLMIYFFIPSIFSSSNTRVMVVSILNIVASFILGFFIYRNNRYPYISYLFIIMFLVINSFGATLRNVSA